MQLHEFKMNENEFGRYFFGMSTNILIEPDEELAEGDIVKLTETAGMLDQETGRNITFRIKEIDRTHGKVKDVMIWNVELRRLKRYKDVYNAQMNGNENAI